MYGQLAVSSHCALLDHYKARRAALPSHPGHASFSRFTLCKVPPQSKSSFLIRETKTMCKGPVTFWLLKWQI